jgi:hypothetical protein
MSNSKYKEIVAAFTGPRGGCKTISAVGWALDAMSHDLSCISNTAIDATLQIGKERKHVQSSELDYNDMLVNPQKYNWCLALFDELQLLANSLRTTSNNNMLLQHVSTQIRKQKMSVFFTIQEYEWADSRFRFQTDVWCECRDLSFTPWGMEQGLMEGELAECTYKDMTGIYTGRPYYKYAESHVFWADTKRLWGTYKTNFLIDPSIGRKQFILDKEKVYVGHNAEGQYIRTVQDPADQASRFQSLLNEAAQQGCDSIPASEMWERAANYGIDLDPRMIGKTLSQYGLESHQVWIRGKGREYEYLFPTHPKHSMNRQIDEIGEQMGAEA